MIYRISLILMLLLTPTPTATTTPPGADRLGYGEVVTGTLTALRPEHLYQIEAHAGDLILVTMDRMDGTLDPLLILTDAAQKNVLATDNDSGGEHNARLRYVIPQDGTYLLRATVAQAATLNGAYRVSLTLTNPTATPPPPEVAARPLYARLVTGREQALLDSRTPFRVYAAVLQRGDTLRAALTVSPTLQAGLYLYRSDFAELTRAELGSRLDLAAPADGVYWLLVAQVGGQGDYTLDAELPARSLDTFDGVRLIPGQAQPGSLSGQVGAFYTFTTLGGLSADVSVSGATVILLNPHLDLIAADASGNIRGAAVREPGSYALLVLASGGPNQLQPLEYTLILRGTPIAQPATTAPTADPTELTYGVTASGTISSAKPRIFYNLRGREGDVITVQMSRVSGSTLDPALLFYQYIDGKPQLIASNDNAAPNNPDAAISGLRLPATGAYLIVAQGVGNTGGAFILSVNRRA